MEHPPPLPRDEHYPLLKVQGGGGDGNIRTQPPPSFLSSRWNVTCASKRSWCSRWPEFVSACWMTIILLAISFLVFYAVGMNAYRRQSVVILRCNDSGTASDVFYHQIVARDANIPLSVYSDYISHMAKKYSALRFNIYFLIDDSFENPLSARHLKFMKRFVPQFYDTFTQNREILDFERQYQNVNVSVMYLSQYMAMTPLRYKWRLIPHEYLTFYARIFATWQYGGIGLDLVAFNNQFNSDQELDSRIDAILQQHNNGINSDKYADTLKSLDTMEENKLFSTVMGFINQLFNETSSFFNTEFTSFGNIEHIYDRPLRKKRDVEDNKANYSMLNNSGFNDTNSTTLNFLVEKEQALRKDLNETTDIIKNNISSKNNNEFPKINNSLDYLFTNLSSFHYKLPQVFFFYDSNGISYNPGPSYYLGKPLNQSYSSPIRNPFCRKERRKNVKKPNYLSISPEGYFVATSSKHHPFLSHIFSAGCQTMSPKYAINDTLLNQCSGFLIDDVYCENIHVIYEAI